jgi:hypothetical protein
MAVAKTAAREAPHSVARLTHEAVTQRQFSDMTIHRRIRRTGIVTQNDIFFTEQYTERELLH